jgi:REP element-mobilizing transposase RayT
MSSVFKTEPILNLITEAGFIVNIIKLISYVLMPNHFNLLVQTLQANLSEFMRHFLVTYTVRFNRRNGRVGHVFQGRFKSLLVDEDEYLLPLSRYIHNQSLGLRTLSIG